MPILNRQRIAPDLGLLTRLMTRRVASMIPTGFRWFGERALDGDAELGKHVRSWGEVLGQFKHANQKQRYNVFFSTAVGEGLSELGRALGFPREVTENDDAYVQRIASELLVERVTPSAVVKAVPFLTTDDVNSEIHEPWRDLLFRGEKSTRSGRRRRPDERFYRGAVFEVVVDEPVPGLSRFLTKSRAVGTQSYLRLNMETQTEVNIDPLAAIFEPTGERMLFVSNSVEVQHESVGTRTEQEPFVLELPMTTELTGVYSPLLSVADGLVFENLSRNYALSVDMLASSQSGTPTHVVVSGGWDPWAPTSIQAFPELQFPGSPPDA